MAACARHNPYRQRRRGGRCRGLQVGLYHYLLKPDGFDNLVDVVRAAFESISREDRNELMVALMQSLPDAVYSVDLEGKISKPGT
jgi:hypothetical protein